MSRRSTWTCAVCDYVNVADTRHRCARCLDDLYDQHERLVDLYRRARDLKATHQRVTHTEGMSKELRRGTMHNAERRMFEHIDIVQVSTNG